MLSSSVFQHRTLVPNESTQSMATYENKRALSLVSAAYTIIDERKNRVDAVKRGYKGNSVFDHTMVDILKVLEHKIPKRSVGHDIFSILPSE
jgi:hypothetical protein